MKVAVLLISRDGPLLKYAVYIDSSALKLFLETLAAAAQNIWSHISFGSIKEADSLSCSTSGENIDEQL